MYGDVLKVQILYTFKCFLFNHLKWLTLKTPKHKVSALVANGDKETQAATVDQVSRVNVC